MDQNYTVVRHFGNWVSRISMRISISALLSRLSITINHD